MGGRNPQVNEDIVGLYSVPPTRRRDYHDGNHRCVEQLFRLKLPLNKFRGQCYDGAGKMGGKRMGVAKRKHELGSRTV